MGDMGVKEATKTRGTVVRGVMGIKNLTRVTGLSNFARRRYSSGRTHWPNGGRTRKPRRPKQGSPHRGGLRTRSNPRKHFLCDDALKH